MSLDRFIDGAEPVLPEALRRTAGPQEERRDARTRRLATASMACPECDAPVLPARAMAPAEPLVCPFCGHDARVRDFLTFGSPVRPARVVVRVR